MNPKNKMVRNIDRECQILGCDYIVGQNGKVADTEEAESDNLSLHIDMKHRIGQAHAQAMKDTKIPVWMEKKSFKSWLDDFELWKENVQYKDLQNVDRLMSM